ncbi:MAG: hypothetical protein ABI140_08605, partial [Jatrophihabitantaceae bacterium]
AGTDWAEPAAGQPDEPAGLLIRVLAEAGLLLSTGPVIDNGLPCAAPVEGGFARTANYLDSFADQPARSFELIRSGTVSVTGSGPASFAAARALLSFGFGTVQVSDPAVAGRLATLASAGLVASIDADADLMIWVGQRPQPAPASIGVLPAGELSFVGPVTDSATGPDLEDVLDRYRLRTGSRPAAADTSPVAAALAGNLAALQALHWRAGLPNAGEPAAHLVHSESLRVQRYPLRRAVEAALRPIEPPVQVRPAGTVAPAVANYLPPADNWLLAVTDPHSGLLARPTAIQPSDTGVHASLVTDPVGQPIAGYGSTAEQAARTALAGAARGLLTDRPGFAVAAAGYSVPELLRDAVRRLALGAWLDPARSAELFEPAGDGCARIGGTELWLASRTVAGRLVALAVDTADRAGRQADRHASLAGAPAGLDPVVSMPDADWDPAPALRALAGEAAVRTVRQLLDPVLDTELLLGWVALAAAEPALAESRSLEGDRA